jgi:flavin-dependent dehydrogenase
MAEIAIVGGGPAGSLCGEQLARSGHSVTILDEHLAWEKPCGGGLTHKAIQAYPFLLHNSLPKKLVHSAELISSDDHRVQFQLPHPIVIYSRTVLNGLLLDRAASSGCSVRRARVTSIDTDSLRPRYCADGEWRSADFLVLAAGARNRFAPSSRPLQPSELEITQGYFVPDSRDTIQIKFLRQFEGYIWSFPRNDHLSVGICGKMSSHTSSELRSHLNSFLSREQLSTDAARFYSHVLPSPHEHSFAQRPVVGRNWALIGDAAAWVDPLTGEGLFYAMRSGEILGRCLADGFPEQYPSLVKAAFSDELQYAARLVRHFYRGAFLGSAVTTTMVLLLRRSSVLRQLVGDLFSGTQDYTSLKRRLLGHLGLSARQFVSCLLNTDRPASLARHSASDSAD